MIEKGFCYHFFFNFTLGSFLMLHRHHATFWYHLTNWMFVPVAPPPSQPWYKIFSVLFDCVSLPSALCTTVTYCTFISAAFNLKTLDSNWSPRALRRVSDWLQFGSRLQPVRDWLQTSLRPARNWSNASTFRLCSDPAAELTGFSSSPCVCSFYSLPEAVLVVCCISFHLYADASQISKNRCFNAPKT